MVTRTGTAANNNFNIVDPGVYIIDGLGGVDTVDFGTEPSFQYLISQGTDGSVHVDSMSGASSALSATLINFEILKFSDQQIDLRNLFGDSSPPTIVSFNPADESAGVAVTANIVVTFSETIVRGSANIVLKTTAGQIVETFVPTSPLLTVSGRTLTIHPTADLSYSTGYVLEFAAGSVKDASTNANPYSGTTAYNFTTASLNTGGKTADITAYSWKVHTLLSGVSLTAGTQTSASDASGAASFAAITESSLILTASRAIPSAEATATSAAVNLQDAIAILKMIVGLEVNGTGKALSPYQALAADYDGNGLVQLTDAIGVLKHVVGLTAPDPVWRFVNELDTTVPSKTTLSPGVAQTSITASLSASSPVKVGLVGYLSGDVDGSFAGATGSSSLTKTYFDTLVAAHPTELSLAQFGVY